LIVFMAVVVALTLSLAWLIERRQVLSLRQELDRFGVAPPEIPEGPPDLGGKPGSEAPRVGWPEDEDL
jgi:hypothetical protein